MTTVESMGATPVAIAGRRGGPDVRTLRKDRWWVSPAVTFTVLSVFIAYSIYAVFINADYYVGAAMHRDLISPFYSPCIGSTCPGSHGYNVVAWWWRFTPAILVLGGPLGFRLTCYYYRRAYYRSFWGSPPACAVSDAHKRYSGETRFPLILQNIHRYFFLIGVIFCVILFDDAVVAYRMPGAGGWGVSVGSLVLTVNAVLLTLYTFSCHAARHLCGGGVRQFSAHRLRHAIWKFLTPLNARHMQFAWLSLIFVAFTDLYVRLVASGAITDVKLF